MIRVLVLLACIVGHTLPALAQARAADPIDAVVRRLERALGTSDKTTFPVLFASSVSPDKIEQLADDLFTPGAVRAAIFERGRTPLEGVPPGDGFRLVVEFFIETPGRGRVITAGIDVRRPSGGDDGSWRISSIDSMSAVSGLYRLRLNTSAPLMAHNLELRSEDVVIALQEGVVFRIECDDGVTGMVLVGRGELRFSPASLTERGQVRIFSGSESLVGAFETAYVRFNPGEYAERIAGATLSEVAADARIARRAQDVFRRQSPLSYSVDLADMSRDAWHLVPPEDDFIADVDTRRFDTLTFSRSTQQAEDVTLYRRSDRKTIALYPSVAKLAARGRFYSDDAAREFDVLDYAVNAAIDPQREFIRARARLSMRIRSTYVTSLMLRLADSLTVSAVSSVEHGRLLHLRMQGQNMISVNVPRPLQQDSDLTLIIDYAGRIESQSLDIDTVQAEAPPAGASRIEPKYLLSNRSYWYPQNPVPDYATGSIRVSVPNEYRCVASGEPVPEGSVLPLPEPLSAPGGRTFTFRANQPLRYLALVVSRMTKVAERQIEFATETVGDGSDPVSITVEANPLLQARGRALLRPAEDVLRFYTSLVGDAPYASAAIALTESDLPGGHSPAYFSLLNEPAAVTVTPTWRGDPAAFEGFPDFFLAHELAHQWWGQAVGWKNYHEQWISEGFAQYFAAMYAQKTRGDRVFVDMLRQFRRWSIEQSTQGPVYLGYRLGHLKTDLRVFRALVYNKGAAVLHMLRRLLGDEAFFRGIRLFYEDRRYQKAGTEDLERAMEGASGRVLDRFFDRWIYNSEIPRISYRTTIASNGVTVEFEQGGNSIFDLPVTVRLVLASGEVQDVMVAVTDKQVVRTLPTTSPVREVQINRDFAAVAEFDER
jgi:hypothetical protein